MTKTKNSIKTIPYRNTMKKNKDFVLDNKVTYKQHSYFIKPSGFWYQINDCSYKWDELDWGEYLYKVVIDPSNILVIKNYQDYVKFDKEYGIERTIKIPKALQESSNISDSITTKYINWKKVSNRYSGFEVKNFNTIKKKLRRDYDKSRKGSWLSTFDFSSGCIWDLKAVKSVNYCCKFSKQLQLNSKLINSKSGSKSGSKSNSNSSKSKRAVKKSSSKKTKKKKIKDDC